MNPKRKKLQLADACDLNELQLCIDLAGMLKTAEQQFAKVHRQFQRSLAQAQPQTERDFVDREQLAGTVLALKKSLDDLCQVRHNSYGTLYRLATSINRELTADHPDTLELA